MLSLLSSSTSQEIPLPLRLTNISKPLPLSQSFTLFSPSRSHVFYVSLNVVLMPILTRSEEHTSELQSRFDLVCRLLLEKKKGSESSVDADGLIKQIDDMSNAFPDIR